MSGSGILSGEEIRLRVARGDILIDPFDLERLNPASYDLTLGYEMATYDAWVHGGVEVENRVLDVKERPTVTTRVIPEEGVVLRPGVGYLMHTRETIWTDDFVPVIDGKSSVGRLFVQVHVTAGYGDPGFRGQYTLEVVVTHPVRLYAGMRVAQVRFHTLAGEPPKLYDGNYQDGAARGPVPSAAWKQFRR